jgi:hypothetical protein
MDIFESYQTFFTGLLGFTGVIITMVVNARHQSNLRLEERRNEINALRVVLWAELDANRLAFENRIQQLEEPSDFSYALVPNQPIDQLYQKNNGHLGLLTEEEIRKVVKAYLLLSDLFYRLRILVGTDNLIGINSEIIRLDKSQREIAIDMHKSFLPDIVAAIKAIDQNYGSVGQ